MKYFLEIQYHGIIKETETFDELFNHILTLYKTKKWWDYDGFRVVQASSYKEVKEKYPDVVTIDWKGRLTPAQATELKQWKEYNLNEMPNN